MPSMGRASGSALGCGPIAVAGRPWDGSDFGGRIGAMRVGILGPSCPRAPTES